MAILKGRDDELPDDLRITRDGIMAPSYVEDRCKRGRDRMKEGAPQRSERAAFWQNNQYVFVNSDNNLSEQPTVTNLDGSGKPRHKVRRVFNLLTPIVGRKVSQSISRVPGYQINASKKSQQSRDAAALSRQIAYYGYDKWRVREATKKVITYALVSDEGFAMPYFDPTVGPFYDDGTAEGEVRIRTYSGSEVFWEPGVDFEDSGWIGIEQARAIEDVKNLPDLLPSVTLNPDAKADTSMFSTSERTPSNTKLVLVTDYFERPTKKHPRGRWITSANDKVIVKPQDYPCEDGDGHILDEPVLHRMTFITDPHSDRGMGLVRFLLDAQRTFNHANNKQIEWVQMALNPQKVVKNGKLVQRPNDEPGAVWEFWGSGDVSWQETPPIPPELEQMKESAREVMAHIAADQDIPTGVESGDAAQTFAALDEGVWSEFYGALAEFHSRLMRHCLYLVQRYYTVERQIDIRGEFGPESITAFTGAQLRGQADVTVLADSIVPRSRAEVESRVRYYAEMAWITPEVAMAAINSGQAESLVNGYERDIGRCERIIAALKQGPEAFMGNPDLPMPPEWMPREFDNVRVHIAMFGDWMKTEDWESQGIEIRTASMFYYQGLRVLEQQQVANEQMQKMIQARALGENNASRPGETGTPERNGAQTGVSQGPAKQRME